MSKIDDLNSEVEFLTNKIVLLQTFILDYAVKMKLVRGEHMCEECFCKLAEDIGIERELIDDLENDLFFVPAAGNC